MYYFPSPFIENEVIDPKGFDFGLTVNCGKNALRIALRSFNLPKNAGIGIPVYSCNEVVSAVLEEDLVPFFFDNKETDSYWADFDEQKIRNSNVKAIILTHLYGFLHPDTKAIIESCHKNDIKMIHDMAQSYGLDVSLFKDQLIVYSFGPGKSTTAAKGGELVNLPDNFKVVIEPAGFIENRRAISFFNSRFYGRKKGKIEVLFDRIDQLFGTKTQGFIGMSEFQMQKALQAKAIACMKNNGRRERYSLLKNAISKLNSIKEAYHSADGLWFKLVIYIKTNPDRFINYLKRNDIPYCRLSDSMDLAKRDTTNTPFFNQSHRGILEISTERSIPLSEIKRISDLLKNYENEN